MEIGRDCLAFDEDLSAWIDGELSGERRALVEAHLAGCGACRARVEELRAVDRALVALPARAPGADLRERLARRLAAERAARDAARIAPPRRAVRRFALALPAAAAAALALYLAWRAPEAPEGSAEAVPVARAPEPPAAPAAEPRGAPTPPDAAPQVAEQAPAVDGELEALEPEELAVAFELDTIEDLPVIANLELLERLLADEAG